MKTKESPEADMRVRLQSIYDANKSKADGDESKVRLVNIFSKGVDIPENFKPPTFKKTSDQYNLIRDAASNNFLFQDLDEGAVDIVIDAMDPFEVRKGTNIINQGETGDYFYVLEKGKVEFFVDDIHVGSGVSGQGFGEIALMYDTPRTATCKAEEPCKLWRVDQTLFKRIIASSRIKAVSNDVAILKKVSFLENLDRTHLNKIAHALTRKEYSAGHKIFNKGQIGHDFYIIQSGTVKLSEIGLSGKEHEDIELSDGDFFGERALLTGDVRAANACAKTDCVLMEMNESDFKELLGPLEDLIEESTKKEFLLEIPMITKAMPQEAEISLMINQQYMQDIYFPKGRTIGVKGEPIEDPCLYIILSGKVQAGDNVLSTGDYFCDDSMLQLPPKYIKTYTSLGDGPDDKDPTKCTYITLVSLATILGGTQRLSKSPELRRMISSFNSKDPAYDNMKLDDIQKMKLIGTGTFGKVWLVKHTDTKEVFAMKIQKKIQILEYNQVAGVMREKEMMDKLYHPFIISMVSAFQDPDNLYMVLRMYSGGELFRLLHQRSTHGVPETAAKFYAACVLEALDYMHVRSIVYRDLKPENILLDSKGYCVIVDLGFAKVVTDKTYTLCGTPLYIAPEVILCRGHDKAADIWSLGVLIYEMVYGKTPFITGISDQMTLFKTIVRGKLNFPTTTKRACNDLIARMLNRRAPFRLGCLKNGADDIRKHKWFDKIVFPAIVKKEYNAPWVPKPKDSFDTANFEDWSHLETEIDAHKKLTLQEQAKFADF